MLARDEGEMVPYSIASAPEETAANGWLEFLVKVDPTARFGATVLSHLVGAGVQHFWLIDSDVVEKSNFNRQFIYNTTHLGQPKVVAEAGSRFRAELVCI